MKFLNKIDGADKLITDANNRLVKDTDISKWNNKAEKTDIPTKLSELTKDINFDERYYTETEIDTKLAGKVDKVSGKGLSTNDFTNVYKNKLDGIEEGANKYIHPNTHPASMITGLHGVATTGIADKLNIVDTRDDNSPPSYYFSQGKNMFWEFKYRASVGNPPTIASASGTYAFILTITGWGDSSGGYPVQLSVGGKNLAIRQGVSTDAWGSWFVIPNMNDLPTKLSGLEKDINFDERYYTESEVDNKLNSKVDKVSGKGLSTEDYTTAEKNKLSGIEAGANKYTHPSSHPASMITESTSRRFVSDAEKASWNNKAEISDIPTKVSQLTNDSGFLTTNDLVPNISTGKSKPTDGSLIWYEEL